MPNPAQVSDPIRAHNVIEGHPDDAIVDDANSSTNQLQEV